MKKYYVMLFVFFAVLVAVAAPGWASLSEATTTLTEGAVGLPTSIVKLVGGLVWTVGEVIALPFKAIF